MEAVKNCSKFGAEVAEEHAIEAGAEDVTSVEGDDQVQLAQYSKPCVDHRHCQLLSVLRIRTRTLILIHTDLHSFWLAGSGSALGIRIRIQEGQMTHNSEESFEVPDLLFQGMKTSPVA
jgi:hypothetical protein